MILPVATRDSHRSLTPRAFAIWRWLPKIARYLFNVPWTLVLGLKTIPTGPDQPMIWSLYTVKLSQVNIQTHIIHMRFEIMGKFSADGVNLGGFGWHTPHPGVISARPAILGSRSIALRATHCVRAVCA